MESSTIHEVKEETGDFTIIDSYGDTGDFLAQAGTSSHNVDQHIILKDDQSDSSEQNTFPSTDPEKREDRSHYSADSGVASDKGEKTIRCGRGINPIPLFDGPIPPREAFEFDRVIFMPSKDRRPRLVLQGNIFRIKRTPASTESRTAWYCVNRDNTRCPAKIYTARCWPCRPEGRLHQTGRCGSFPHG